MSVKVCLDEKKIDEQIAKKNLWCKTFAGMVEISPSYLSQLINGKRSPSPELRQKFLKILQCEGFDDLFVIKDKDDIEKVRAVLPLSKET